MSARPQHQHNIRALARVSAPARPGGLPAYYLGRPASLWISVTSPGRRAEHTRVPGGRHPR